ncbi:MAG: hypothetical protein IK016_09620 [Lachnospiraceae bacterium]|nr:hypothetical protein [Lachnospiraceae bacterium]
MMLRNAHKAKGYVLGYDLGMSFSQISFMELGASNPRTLSVLTGQEIYDIPTLLARREDINQWYFGREALKQIEDMGAIRVDRLIELAMTGTPVTVGDQEYDPVSLLALFVKRSLSLLSMELDASAIRAMMFTTAQMDARMVEVLRGIVKALQLPMKHVFFQSYAESFYHYMLRQDRELWQHQVLACDYHYELLRTYVLQFNAHTTPVVASVEEQTFRDMEFNMDGLPEDKINREKALSMLDTSFYDTVENLTRGKVFSTVYLLGNGFKDKWMKRSLEYLCRTRKVFQGSNLFNKGAAFAANARLQKDGEKTSFVLLDAEKLRFNLGITAHVRGKEQYCGILEGGSNWYEASAAVDVILEQGDSFFIQATPLSGGIAKSLAFSLQGLPEREERTTRLSIAMEMLSVNRLKVTVTDLGFGEYALSSGTVLTEEYDL